VRKVVDGWREVVLDIPTQGAFIQSSRPGSKTSIIPVQLPTRIYRVPPYSFHDKLKNCTIGSSATDEEEFFK
jgi:hypothetical protein